MKASRPLDKFARFAFLLLIAAATIHALHAADSEEGFTSLFDGKTRTGWIRLDKRGADYFVTNGFIVCPENTSRDLLTEKMYLDFVLDTP